MNIIAIAITIVNLILLIFLLLRFRWNKYQEKVIKRLKKEVSLIITELNKVTDRNITLIEDAITRSENQIIKDRNKKGNVQKKSKIDGTAKAVKSTKNNFDNSNSKITKKNSEKVNVNKSEKIDVDINNNIDNELFKNFYQKASYNKYKNIGKKIRLDDDIDIKEKDD